MSGLRLRQGESVALRDVKGELHDRVSDRVDLLVGAVGDLPESGYFDLDHCGVVDEASVRVHGGTLPRSGWWDGATNAIDRLIIMFELDAIEISWRLDVPIWMVRERFARYHGQYEVAA